MSTIRIPENVRKKVYSHLFGKDGEHFAFMLARWTYSRDEPVFMVRDAILVPDSQVKTGRGGWELTTQGIVDVINAAVRSGDALIEAHNHGGALPRFSPTDQDGLREFPTYVIDSLPGRPYGATVWGDSTVYAEYFSPDRRTGVIDSIITYGDRLCQLVSRDDDRKRIDNGFARQLPWFTTEGQRRLGRLRVAIAGTGGTGSALILNLVYLGVRDFVLIEYDEADSTSMNRLVTATAADIETHKGIMGRRFVKSIAPDAKVALVDAMVQSAEAIDALKGVDVLFGCFDNDAPRLILNELALAYSIPYFDLAVGIDAEDGVVSVAGGRVAVALPGGPCLHCMGEIDRQEAAFFLSSEEERAFQIQRGYVRGMDIKAPSVVSVNGAIATTAANEFAIFVSGSRPISVFTELDLLGVGRPVKSQWLTPRVVSPHADCVQCAIAGTGDAAGIERYARSETPTKHPVN